MNQQPGKLYIVATPIGNLGDITLRAQEVLGSVDLILAEDTRHSRPLLNHFGIQVPLQALHEHNEDRLSSAVVSRLESGESMALISDAGTPLISDPGYPLVRLARSRGIVVVPLPGACAMVTALSASGLATDRFVFEGFLPSKKGARRKRLEQLVSEPRTLVFYESSHRIADSLADMADLFGPGREAVIARELTKRFETIHGGELSVLVDWTQSDSNQQKGEFVVMVSGAPETPTEESSVTTDQVLKVLMAELPLKQAASLAAGITGQKRNRLYERALELKEALI